MINWRTSQNYLLLFAIAFKTLILGTMLTLATHNICLGQLLNDDINWTQIVCKQRKRNDDHSSHAGSFFNHTAIIPETGRSVWLRKCFVLPLLFFVWLTCLSRRLSGKGGFDPLVWYTPDKIFIRHCAIVR